MCCAHRCSRREPQSGARHARRGARRDPLGAAGVAYRPAVPRTRRAGVRRAGAALRGAGGAPRARRGYRYHRGRRRSRRVCGSAGAYHPRGLARADRLPGRHAPHAGRARHPGGQSPAHHRAHGGQAVDHGAARAGGAASARNGGVRERGCGAGGVPRAGRRDREAAVRLDGARDGAGNRRGDGVPRVSHAGNAARRILCPADDRSRRLRRAGVRGGWPRDRRDRAERAGLEDQSRAWRARAGRDARAPADRAGPRRGPRGRCGLCGRRSPARARRHCVRRGGKRDSRMARPAGGDVARRRRGDRRGAGRAPGATVSGTWGAAQVAAAAQLACLLEVSAPKPGNVSPFAGFRDASYEDFLASAAAIGPALTAAAERSLGATIRAAVEATARWAPSNTNLGLVLLLAPLARAELRPGLGPLRARLTATLADTTVGDARDAYVAIRSAAPGGLGRASEQDVAGTPTVTLREAMALARDRDAVAREYAADFATTFEIGAPGLHRALSDRLAWRDAVVEVYLTLLAAAPDSHIVRKLGTDAAVTVQRRARVVLDAGGVRTMAGREATAALDRELRDEANTLNPGATADLTGASIYVVLLEGGWRGRP